MFHIELQNGAKHALQTWIMSFELTIFLRSGFPGIIKDMSDLMEQPDGFRWWFLPQLLNKLLYSLLLAGVTSSKSEGESKK